ncbi:hypothetical protein BZG01_10855 [Labilibaculum manganireducens]|uniref:DUF1573 domain-containing protein n=1 Tax=Labilibaculum manganireducens TaxID=1940525 RepID=A0A2N3I888_9BACT|nr:hypothetical protein BZG01_10855 [Labilibaculum manganireducens]
MFCVWFFAEDYSVCPISTQVTQIKFDIMEIDMGQLEQGKPKTVSFQYKNIGEHPLLIQHVETSCGCTQPEWTKQPIKPGDSAEIKVSYDAKYSGRFFKTITVFCNTLNGMNELKIKGEVKLSVNNK